MDVDNPASIQTAGGTSHTRIGPSPHRSLHLFFSKEGEGQQVTTTVDSVMPIVSVACFFWEVCEF